MIYALCALAGFVAALVAMKALVSMRPEQVTFDQHAQLAIYCALTRVGADGGTGTMMDAVELASTFKTIVGQDAQDD